MNFDHFWLITYCDLTKKQVLVKIAQKWMICRKQSLKNEKQFFFLQNIKNTPSIWFPHRFSISAQNVTPKGLVDAPDPQEAVNQA